jgi:NitT/TauT family transport system substrate-binding protein
MKRLPALALCLLITPCAFGELAVGLMPAANSIPLVVAAHDGLFEAEGVTVRLVPFSGQLERETALQTGAIDGTVSDLINAIQSWSHGSGAKVTSVTEGSFSLLASPQSGMHSMRDFDAFPGGKVRTGLLENSLVYYLTEHMLTAARVDTSRVDLVPIVQLPARLEMLLAGKIDAACLPEPLATLGASRGAVRLAVSDDLGTAPGVLLFTGKALANRAADIAALYRAYNRAVDAVNKAPETYREAIVKGCDFPPAVSGIMSIPRFQAARLPSRADVSDVGAWMREKGLLVALPGYTDIVAAGFGPADARAP